MIVWVFNIWLYFLYFGGQNGNVQAQQAYQDMVNNGATAYTCVDLSQRAVSTACTQPAPKSPYGN